MADEQNKKITVDDLPPVTLPMTGNENIPVYQAGIAKRMKPGDFPAVGDGFVKIDGSTPFAGNQSMAGFKLTEVGAPADPGDGTNKTYVDGRTSWGTIEW